MIARLIHWSIGNRFLVLLATVMLTAWGVVSMLRTLASPSEPHVSYFGTLPDSQWRVCTPSAEQFAAIPLAMRARGTRRPNH